MYINLLLILYVYERMCDIYREVFVGLDGYDCVECGVAPCRYTVNRVSQCIEYEVIVMTLGYDCCKIMRRNVLDVVIRVNYDDSVMDNMEETIDNTHDDDYDEEEEEDEDEDEDSEYNKMKEENRRIMRKLSRNCFLR